MASAGPSARLVRPATSPGRDRHSARDGRQARDHAPHRQAAGGRLQAARPTSASCPATPRSSPRFQRPRPAPFSLSFHALWHQGKRTEMYEIHISFWLSIAVAIAVMAWLLRGSSFNEKRRRNLPASRDGWDGPSSVGWWLRSWAGWSSACGAGSLDGDPSADERPPQEPALTGHAGWDHGWEI